LSDIFDDAGMPAQTKSLIFRIYNTPFAKLHKFSAAKKPFLMLFLFKVLTFKRLRLEFKAEKQYFSP